MKEIKRLYFWLTGLTCLIGLLAMLFAGYTAILVLIFFPIGLAAMYIAGIAPTIALGFLCALPAVALLPRWTLSLAMLIAGAGVFASQTLLVPYQAREAAQAFRVQTETDPQSFPSGATAQIILNDRKTGYGCGTLCQTLLIDAQFATVRVHGTATDAGVSYRLAEGKDCIGVYQGTQTCILVARSTDAPPDLRLSYDSARHQLGRRQAHLLGLAKHNLFSAQTRDGTRTFARTSLRPVTGAMPVPRSLQGGLDVIDRKGLTYDRTAVHDQTETDLEFLQRLGLTVGQTLYNKRAASLKNSWTFAAREDALSGPMPPKVAKRLERYKLRLVLPGAFLTGSAAENLAKLESLLDGTRPSGTEMSTVKLEGHQYLIKTHPEHRTETMKSFLRHLTASEDVLSNRLSRVLRLYRDVPERWSVDDLPGAGRAYADYLDLLRMHVKPAERWRSNSFEVYGAFFGLPSVPPEAIVDVRFMENALIVQCRIAHRDPDAARAYAIAAVTEIAAHKAEYDGDIQRKNTRKSALLLAYHAGNFDEVFALWQERIGDLDVDAATWLQSLDTAAPPPCSPR